MSNRWDELPPSAHEQELQLSMTTTTTPASAVAAIRKNIGELLRQEITDTEQILCYYRNVANANPITYICELGCCPSGCCAAEELTRTASASSYGWAITLLVVFLAAVFLVLVTLFLLYLLNRHNDRKHRDQLADIGAPSSTASQISGPSSFYGHEAYYPYVGNVKTY